MTPQLERIIALCLLAAIAALSLALAIDRGEDGGRLFYLITAIASGGFVARLRPAAGS